MLKPKEQIQNIYAAKKASPDVPVYGIRSLHFKIALTSVLVEVVMLALLITNSVSISTRALEEQTRYRINELVPLLNASLASPLVQRDYATMNEILTQIIRQGGIEYIAISDEDGLMVAVVGDGPAVHTEGSKPGHVGDLSSYHHLDFPITLAGSRVGELHMRVDTYFLKLTISTLQREGLLIASGEVAITFILLVLVGVLLTRNLAQLASAAKSMTEGNLSVRVNSHSRDEIGDTARAFDGMAARLERSYSSLKKSEQLYQALTEVSPVGIFNNNKKGECIYVNERYSQIAGIPQRAFQGEGWIKTLHPDDRERVVRDWSSCSKKGIPYIAEYRILSAKGKVVWVFVQAIKSNAVVGGYVGTVTDVTHLKSVEQELSRHRDSLEELVAERTFELKAAQSQLLRQERLATLGQLTATVSHELRNPLGIISNAAYYLKRKSTLFSLSLNKELGEHLHKEINERFGDKSIADRERHNEMGEVLIKILNDEFTKNFGEKLTHYLEMISQEVAGAEQIISDLLATSRTKKPVLQWVNLDDVVASAVEQNLCPSTCRWEYRPSYSPFTLRVDPVQLNQVLRNLLTNAVQSIMGTGRNDGLIQLWAKETDEYYQLRMSDNGLGIDKDKRAHIFEPLYTTKAKGNGLGLWISREIIRAHGGDIVFESNEGSGGGAVFVMTLPKPLADTRVKATSMTESPLALVENNTEVVL